MDISEHAKLIKEQFKASRRILAAIGDETRQSIILTLMEMEVKGECEGMRVGEITAKTHLSRPAVSHHLKILLEAGMIGVTPEGTKNFYWLTLGAQWDAFVALVNNIEQLRAFGGNCDC
ncbi:MAG: ArsR family transcriptional regulator [Clostridiales bacterium]|jgi:ArsR family transcriptional regulator|nr:ArsR family transcriptional regulator [Clostridiales bacterium]